jgi:hypothetical protein
MIIDNKLDLSSKNTDEIKKYLEAILAIKYKFRIPSNADGFLKITIRRLQRKADCLNQST